MDNNKQRANETDKNPNNQPLKINLSDYAGDAEDDKLACDPAHEYLEEIEDLNKRLRQQEERKGD